MSDFYEARHSEPGEREHLVQFVGGTAAITKTYGRSITATYVSTGLVDLTWSANAPKPGTFVGPRGMPGFRATVQSGVKGYTAVVGDYSTTTRTLRVAIYDASNNLVDLAAAQWLTLVLVFLVEAIGP